MSVLDVCRRTARRTFGVERLRPEQESAMSAVGLPFALDLIRRETECRGKSALQSNRGESMMGVVRRKWRRG